MQRGTRLPPGVRQFIIDTKGNAPGLTYPQVCDRVQERFGLTVDKSTVGKVWKRSGMATAGSIASAPSGAMKTAETAAFDLPGHRSTLLAPLLELKGIGSFALHDHDPAYWYGHPSDRHWPIAQGRVEWRDGAVVVILNAEEGVAWPYLQQHLPGDPVWGAIEGCKDAIARDVQSRLALLEVVIKRLEKPEVEDGLGTSVVADFKSDPNGDAVSFSYAFVIADEALSKALGLAHTPTSEQAFEPWRDGLVHLAGRPVIRARDEASARIAVRFLIEAQATYGELPEATAAAADYRRAEKAADELKRHVERLRLTPAFRLGTTCDLCRDLLSTGA